MNWSEKIKVLLLLTIPLFLQITWQCINLGLPISDGGDHFRITNLLYLAFSEGLGHGLYFFFHTGGKPILFSIFTAPFVYFAKFNVLYSIRLSLIAIEILGLFAYYWLFTALKIRPVMSALLTCAIMTIPYIFSMSTQFMPETLWQVWFVLFLATLCRSQYLTKSKLTVVAGILLAFTILTRPVESVVLIFPGLAVYCYYLYVEKKIISLVSFFVSFVVALLPIVICFLSSIKPDYFYAGVVSIIMMMCILIYRSKAWGLDSLKSQNAITVQMNRNRIASSRVEIFLLPFSLICSGWFLFYGVNIYHWAYDNSFGNGAKTNDQVNLTKSIFRISWEVIQAYGAFPIVTLFLFMVFSFLFIKTKIVNRKPIYFAVLAVVLMLSPMLFAYSTTGTSDMRRIYLGMVLLIIVMSGLTALKTERSNVWRRLFLVMLIAVTSVQVLSIIAITTQNHHLLRVWGKITNKVGTLNYPTPSLQKSEDAQVIREIKSLVPTNASIAVFSLGMFSPKVLFQSESLRYVTLQIEKSYTFGTMWGYMDYEPFDAVLVRVLQNNYQYLLLEDLDNPITDPALAKRLRSHTFFVHDALRLIKQKGETNLLGLQLIKKFKIDDRFVYLFKVYNPDLPKITASSQLAGYGPEGLFDAKDPGWHSESSPKYPQVIHVEFNKVYSINTLRLLAQQGNADRAPKQIQVKFSMDGHSWKTAVTSDDACPVNTSDGWHDVTLPKSIKARFIEVVIRSNCGNPDLLTLRGLRIK